MRAGQIADHALGKPGAWADQPWEGDHVAKVHDKIFAFLGAEAVGVKAGATREEADEWLARFPDDASVMAYIGRSGWNTLAVGGVEGDLDLAELAHCSHPGGRCFFGSRETTSR